MIYIIEELFSFLYNSLVGPCLFKARYIYIMIYKFEPNTMATGLDSLDHQHENLFELSNRMETLAQGDIDHVAVERALVALRNYGLAHFVHEERMMDVYICPMAKANKDAHGLFVEKTKEWFKRLGECQGDSERKMHEPKKHKRNIISPRKPALGSFL